MSDSYRVSKLTDCKWANLFEVDYARKKQPRRRWIMCSRNDDPVADASRADAVVIVATIDADGEKKLVVTKEFRVPIWDFEYGFPIRHISTPVFSSAGLTDESCHMVLVEAQGQASDKWLDESEDIEVLLLDVEGIRDLLASDKKIAAKAWGLLYHYAQTGEID